MALAGGGFSVAGWRRVLAQASWLTAARARAYGQIVVLVVTIGAIAPPLQMVLATHADPLHRPPITDFTLFYATAQMAAAGHATEVYDAAKTDAAVNAIAEIPPGKTLPYFYPPVFLLVTRSLAVLPYAAAYAVFFLTSGAICFAVFTALARRMKLPARLAIASPAVLITFWSAQNGFISASIFATMALLLETRPFAAGLVLGVFACKPQLALTAPLALLAARRFATFAGALLSGSILIALPAIFYGPTIWLNFWAARAGMRVRLEIDRADWVRQLSPFTAIRLWGAPITVAYMLQIGAALAVLLAVCWACRRRPGAVAEIALMSTGAVLLTPHVIDYDIVMLTPALMFLLCSGLASGFRPYEKTMLLAAYTLPVYARALNAASLPLGCAVLAALFILVWRRAQSPSSPVLIA